MTDTKYQKVLLVSILQNSHRNLSCLALYSYLREHGIDVSLIFLPVMEDYDADLFKQFLSKHNFNVAGISLMTDGFVFAGDITADIREIAPGTHVVWGGIHPTLKPGECLEHADSVCVGEGEITLLALLERLSTGGNIEDLPGIATKSAGEGVTSNQPPLLIEDLDSLPFVKYDWPNFYIQDNDGLRNFTIEDYSRYSNYGGEDYTLMTSRSCPFSCSYCCNSFLNSLYDRKGRARKRTVTNVLEEVKFALNAITGLKFINFIDDQFFSSRDWNEEFCRRYKHEINLPFIVRLAPGSFREDDLVMLKDAGLKFVQIGIQSGSDRTNKEIFNRRYRRDAIVEASQVFSRHGIHPFYDVIIQNEFEDDSDRDKTIQLLLDLEKPFSLILYALTPFPGTKLETMYRDKGIKPVTDVYGKNYADSDKTDFYYQLASVIPVVPDDLAQHFFKNSKDDAVRAELDEYYNKTEEQRQRITAQEKNEND